MVPRGQVDRALKAHLQQLCKLHQMSRCVAGSTPEDVDVCTVAQHLRIEKKAAQVTGGIREEKVAEIRQSVIHGDYSPAEVENADRMLRRAIERPV